MLIRPLRPPGQHSRHKEVGNLRKLPKDGEYGHQGPAIVSAIRQTFEAAFANPFIVFPFPCSLFFFLSSARAVQHTTTLPQRRQIDADGSIDAGKLFIRGGRAA